ncbi:hypothetical protein SAMN05444364_1632 [Prevotella scopos JCM 17725]|uniref:Uncharacterized protein n=1 Tax=Prevotella scopos JCM 17725 TaxID=1236518 RepID=A0AAX2F7R9_9BACT|nr:hypothetical protein SAMN05444364_1632 [Prevotella scopos JCM 17725]
MLKRTANENAHIKFENVTSLIVANDGFSRKIFIITIIVILKQYTQYLRIMNNW